MHAPKVPESDIGNTFRARKRTLSTRRTRHEVLEPYVHKVLDFFGTPALTVIGKDG